MEKLFTREDAWAGADYGLAIVSKPGDRDLVTTTVRELWKSHALDGCYARRDIEPHLQGRIEPLGDAGARLAGVAVIEKRRLPCSTYTTRMASGEDWVYLSIPMGSLEALIPREPPSMRHAATSAIDEWFLAHARRVFDVVRFHVGFIGWMPGTEEDDELARFDQAGVPSDRRLGFVVPSGDMVAWHPPTSRT